MSPTPGRYNLRRRGSGGKIAAPSTPPSAGGNDADDGAEEERTATKPLRKGGEGIGGAEELKAKKKLRSSTFRRLLSFASPDAGRLTVAMVSLLVSSGTNMAFPTIVGKVVDRAVLREGELSNKAFFSGAILIFACGGIASWSRTYNFGVAANRIARRLRTKIFARLLTLDAPFHDSKRSGELVGLLTDDVEVTSKICTEKAASALRSMSSALNGTAMLFALSPRLTLLSLAMVPVIGAGAMAYSKRVKRFAKSAQEFSSNSTAYASERLFGIGTVQLCARENVDADLYSSLLDAMSGMNSRAASAQGIFMGGLSITVNASLMAVLYAGGSLVAQGAMTVGNLTSFAIYSSMVGLGFSGLGGAMGDISRGLGSAERIFDLLDVRPSIESDLGKELPAIKGHIVIKDVWFHYPQREQQHVLSGLSLEIRSGDVLALTGKSGAGKSTILALLSRMYDVNKGKISLDGEDITSLNPRWLRRNMGVVDQDPVLFEGSIADNIRYSKPGASDSEVERAATNANADAFITDFPSGYDTLVGERGKQLSGGQKQRIAIARAFLKDAKILLLDEATSALDGESERMVQSALDRLMKGRTTIIVAHRRSTVASASRVAVLDEGRVVEEGPYATLMENRKSYLARLMHTNALELE